MSRLDATCEEAAGGARDIERGVVVARLAAHFERGHQQSEALEFVDLRGLEPRRRREVAARVGLVGRRGDILAPRRLRGQRGHERGLPRRRTGRSCGLWSRALGYGHHFLLLHGHLDRLLFPLPGLPLPGLPLPGLPLLDEEHLTGAELVEAFLDDLQREEVLLLLVQDPAQTGEVGVVELAVPRRRALRVDEPLALEEPDLRDRDVGELVTQFGEHLADREMTVHARPFMPAGPRAGTRARTGRSGGRRDGAAARCRPARGRRRCRSRSRRRSPRTPLRSAARLRAGATR